MPIPKIIWVLWIDFNNDTSRDLDSLDESIRIYITNMINTQPTFEIRYILSKTHLENFIEKTGMEINEKMWNIIDNAVISPAHKSDVIRFYLLNEYGGIWIDTTTILFYDLSKLIGEYDLVLPYMSITKAIELFFDVYNPTTIYNNANEGKKINENITNTMTIINTCKYVPENYFIATVPRHSVVNNILNSLLQFWHVKPSNKDELKQKLVDEMFRLVYGDMFVDDTYDYTRTATNFLDIWSQASYLFNYVQLYNELCSFCNVPDKEFEKTYDFETNPNEKKDDYIFTVCNDNTPQNDFCNDIVCKSKKIKLFSAAYLRLFRWTIPNLNNEPVIELLLQKSTTKQEFISKMKELNIAFLKMSSFTRNSPLVGRVFAKISETSGGKCKSRYRNKKSKRKSRYRNKKSKRKSRYCNKNT
jgi:hypothetical protein